MGWSARRTSDLSRVLTGVGHGLLIETAIQRTPGNSKWHIGAKNSAQKAAMTSRSLWGGGPAGRKERWHCHADRVGFPRAQWRQVETIGELVEATMEELAAQLFDDEKRP